MGPSRRFRRLASPDQAETLLYYPRHMAERKHVAASYWNTDEGVERIRSSEEPEADAGEAFVRLRSGVDVFDVTERGELDFERWSALVSGRHQGKRMALAAALTDRVFQWRGRSLVGSCVEAVPVDSGLLQVSPWCLGNPVPLNLHDCMRVWLDGATSVMVGMIEEDLLKALTHGAVSVSCDHRGNYKIQNVP